MNITTSTRKILWIALAVVAVIAVAFGAFAFWFLRDDAPDEVAIADAAAQVTDTTPEARPDTTPATSPPPTPPDAGSTEPNQSTTSDVSAETTEPGDGTTTTTGDLAGTWNVDTTIGEFSFEDSTGTFVGFRVKEELTGIGSTTAVGRTPAVAGTLTVDGTAITAVSIDADMTALTTNDRRRDDRVHGALDTRTNPSATFELLEPIELDDTALAGQAVSVEAIGDLTINGITTTVTFPLDAQLVGDTIVVVGSLDVTFADYDVSVPSAPVVLSAEDHGPIELQLFFTRA